MADPKILLLVKHILVELKASRQKWAKNKGTFKRAKGSKVNLDFLIVSDTVEENVSYQELFRIKKILFLAKGIAFLIVKNAYNLNVHKNFYLDSQSSQLKIYLIQHFLRYTFETW